MMMTRVNRCLAESGPLQASGTFLTEGTNAGIKQNMSDIGVTALGSHLMLIAG
jgi:hypothetical protein